jgi:hypothetical protein
MKLSKKLLQRQTAWREEHRTGVYMEINEDSSTGATQQEFLEKAF